MDLHHVLDTWTATDIGRALARRDIDAVALADASLTRAEDNLHATTMIKVTRERAQSEARASAMRLKMGAPVSPLDGVPMVVKDLIDLEGEITTAGSHVYRNSLPKFVDASCAANLKSNGMICIGKVNLSEFAFSGLGLNPHFGTPINPYALHDDRAPGGSSSGTATAISQSIVPCGIGTDTGGSVRIPASFNGLVGYKNSFGRIDKTNVFALSRLLDTIGPIGRSVQDCIHIDAALRGNGQQSVTPNSVAGLQILVPQSVVLDDVQPDVLRNFDLSLERLSAAGAIIKEITFEPFSKVRDLTGALGSLASAEAYTEHLQLVKSGALKDVDPRVVDRILAGRDMSAVDLLQILRMKEELTRTASDIIGEALVAMPTTAITAPKVSELDADSALFHRINTLVLRNTSLGNFLDFPGLALPNGNDSQGLPTSILLSAASGHDAALLAYGLTIEPIVQG